MIIDIFTPFFRPPYGGVENATLNLAKELNKTCEVRIHTFNCFSEDDIRRFPYFYQKFQELESIEGLPILRHPFFYFPFIKFLSIPLTKAILHSKAHIVHIQGFSTLLSNLVLLNLARTKIFILTMHGLHEGLDKINNLPLSTLIRKAIVHCYLNKFHRIIVLSNIDKQILENIGCNRWKIAVIPNGIDESKFQRREHFMQHHEQKKILCVARFADNKGYEDLLKALRLVKDKADFMAYFIGSVSQESYFKMVKDLIADLNLEGNVIIGTSLSDSQLTNCYQSSDIFVLPSLMETSPLVIREAMYFGLPIVATAVGGIPELIKSGTNGYLVQPRNPEQLADKILSLLRDDKLRSQLAERNKKESRKYTWEKIAQQTSNLYQEVLTTGNLSVGTECKPASGKRH